MTADRLKANLEAAIASADDARAEQDSIALEAHLRAGHPPPRGTTRSEVIRWCEQVRIDISDAAHRHAARAAGDLVECRECRRDFVHVGPNGVCSECNEPEDRDYGEGEDGDGQEDFD